ncbi:MAG: AEC family transporter [Acetatifactor sp.]|nr:AEC family transporter [Acetatifactor sp.]
MDQLIFSLNATVPLFLMMLLGFILRQIGMFDDNFVKKLNTFNFKVTLPVLLFTDISSSNFLSVWDTKYVLFCFFVTLFCILCLWFVGSLFIDKKGDLGEFVQGSYRSAAATLGIAFTTNIYGDSGMGPLMIIASVPLYNIAAVLILSFSGPSGGSLDKKALKGSLLGVLKNPILIGIFTGIAASLINLRFPPMLDKAVNNVAVLSSPLTLIGLGASFEGAKAVKKIAPTLASSFIKLVLWPGIFVPLALLLGFRNESLIGIVTLVGLPTTASSFVMAKSMGHDGVLTSSIVVVTTFLCPFTLTVILYILKTMGAI